MRSTRQLSITLPTEMAADVRAKVESGDYASESEVIREGLRALQARERALEAWLRTGHDAGAMGNFDPVRLFAGQDHIRAEAKKILDQAAGRPGHIFNLGHGILPETPVGQPQLKTMELGPRDRVSQAYWHELQKGNTVTTSGASA